MGAYQIQVTLVGYQGHTMVCRTKRQPLGSFAASMKTQLFHNFTSQGVHLLRRLFREPSLCSKIRREVMA